MAPRELFEALGHGIDASGIGTGSACRRRMTFA